ncbi:YqzK family protein [Falsibacillus pallidus]|uniref:YqzK family protein n=1 Tax=Falsibacillus pallidus TaxID=493781 RepID=UPI003D99AD9A
MRTWLALFWQSMKVFILFTGCTILFYCGIMWVNQEYQDYHRYDKPEGAAVKVYNSATGEDVDWFNRLVLFYLDGE